VSKLSVIIPSVNGLPAIGECLAALTRQQGDCKTEIVIVDRCRNGTAEHIRTRFPEVKLVRVAPPIGIPEMRSIGLSQATGDIIAFTEDHCIAPEDWCEKIIKAHQQSGYQAIGGAIENGSVARIRDWAAYLCEYSGLMPPLPSGEVDSIAGNNASYARTILESVNESVKRDCWEFFLQEELKARGVKFLSAPEIVLAHKKEFDVLYFVAQRFHYSRSFAAMRAARVSGFRRVYYVITTPALPFLLLWRIASQVTSKRRHYKEFILSLPLLLLYGVSYAFGEFIGYLIGPGQSLAKVE
jgi:glycosyltransferase involved in cell wall biosynthesis